MRKYYKFKMNLVIGNILAFVFLILAAIPVFDKISSVFNQDSSKSLALVLILYIFWMLLHEILHGIGHLLCGVKLNQLSFGANIEKGVLFCLVRREVKKKGILISLLFPFFFIGVVTYIIGIIINSPILIILSIFNISGASVDLLMFYNFIKLGNDISYIEPGDGTSFYLMSDKEINKLTGLTKVEEGEYKEDMFENIKYKTFDITRGSIIFFILSIVASLIILIF